jgi:hypothetical protein
VIRERSAFFHEPGADGLRVRTTDGVRQTFWPAKTLQVKVPRMNSSNPISSMTRLSGTPATDMEDMSSRERPPVDASALACLARLDAVLKSMEQLLAEGKAEELPEASHRAASIAHEMSMLYSQSPLLLGMLAVDAKQQLRLMFEIRRKAAFCMALLRRWRRAISLRERLLSMAAEPVTYTTS